MVVIGVPAIFIIIVIFSAYFYYRVKSSNPNTKPVENMIEKEIEANGIRKKEIEPEAFVTPDISELPFRDDLDKEADRHLYARQEKVLELSGKKMLHFKREYSNLELKSRYGYSNLEFVVSYEENYSSYILALNLWAEELISRSFNKEALIVLKHAISLGPDISKSYTLLADIYHAEHMSAELDALLNTVAESDLSSKNIIVKHIKELLIN